MDNIVKSAFLGAILALSVLLASQSWDLTSIVTVAVIGAFISTGLYLVKQAVIRRRSRSSLD